MLLIEKFESQEQQVNVYFEMISDKASYSVIPSVGESKVFTGREAADHYLKQLKGGN
jgi:hypothetical protein